ncbi:MAG: hypothetical protein ACK4ME_10300 [Fimbriimonadales bacterium]
MHCVNGFNWDRGATTGGTYELYHPTNSSNAVTVNNLDLSTDITGVWATDPVQAGKRAYRRYVGMATGRWLQGLCTLDGLIVAHPPGMLSWADPAEPLRPIDWSDPNLRINFLLEVAWNLEKVVRVLDGYIRFGTVREYVRLRERMFEP